MSKIAKVDVKETMVPKQKQSCHSSAVGVQFLGTKSYS